MWAGLLAAIPNGWHLCDGTSGTPDLRSMFIKGSAAGINPGVTGGTTLHTPSGTVAIPVFTGDLNTTSATSAGTPAGTNSAPAFTGNSVTSSAVSAGTPAGTIDAHTSALLLVSVGSTNVLEGPGTHTFTGSAMGTHTHTTTATGTVAAPSFAGNALGTHTHTLTPTGTNSAPAFTGTAANYEPAFYSLAFIQKL